MDPSMDRDLAEINFRPRTKGRKSYMRDSHGFELEKNYFQDESSDGESSISSEGSFTLSLGKDTKQPRQQRTSNQRGITTKLPSGTRSDRSSHYSPSPLRTYNHSPAKVTTNPKKRLTFDMDSNEENRKHESESISESEEDGATVIEEVLPGSYSASGVNPTPNRSVRHDGSTHKKSPVKAAAKSPKQKSPAQAKPTITSQSRKPQKGHQKSSFQLAVTANSGKKRQTFDLGEFSTSSSDTDEEVEGIKRSLFVRPVGKETLMCLPKLSEYIKPRQKTVGGPKKEIQKKAETQQHQRSEKRKASDLNNVVASPTGTKRRRKTVHVIEKETTPVEESTATEDESAVAAVRTERNPKLSKKKRASSVNVKPRSTSKKQKPVANRASARRHGNRSSNSPVSDSSQKSFAVLHNTTSKIIDSIYGNDEQDVEEDVRTEIEQSPQRVTRCRPSISFTSKGEESRQTQSRKNKTTQNIDLSSAPDTKEVDVTVRHNQKRPLNSEEQSHGVESITEDQKRQRRRSPKVLSSEGEMTDGSTKVTEQQPKKKKKKDVTARQRPAKEVGINKNKNKEQLLQKDKEKKRPRGAKRRQLIDESRAESQYIHIPLAKPQAMDDTLRRSSRTRVPRINHLLGEELIYEVSPSGGLVVKEIIRPATSSSHLSIFEQKSKPVKKRNKQSSRNASQSQSSKSDSKITKSKEKERKRKDQKVTEEDTEELKEKPVKKLPHKASNPKKTLPTVDHTNTPVAMVDPITFDDSGHSKNTPTNKSKAVTHNEQAERTLVLRPMSPRSKESFGNSLMKSMFQSDSCLATESVEIISDDGTARPPVEVIKPLQSLRLCNASGSMVTPNDPFIMAILSRQKNSNYGIAILNKMGDKGEQYTSDSSVCFFLISGEIMVKIGDLELHPPVWSRIYVPEGVTYSLRNLQHTPAVLSYMVIKPNKDHD